MTQKTLSYNKLKRKWQIQEKLILDLKLKNFSEVVELVNKIKDLANKLDHHPNLELHDYKYLKIILFTHETGGITEKDLNLASEIEKIL